MYFNRPVTKFGSLEEEKRPIPRTEGKVILPLDNNKNFLSLDEKGNIKNNLNMNNKRILNLPLPIDENEPTTKVYVDTTRDKIRRENQVYNPFNFRDEKYVAKNKINMMGFPIENTAPASNPGDLVQLGDVKKLIPFEEKNGGFIALNHIYLKNKKLGGLRDPKTEKEATNKGYVDREIKTLTDYSKKFFDGTNYQIDSNFNLRNYRIFNVPDPMREDEIVNKKYVDVKTGNLEIINNGDGAFVLSKDKSKYEAKNDLDIKNFKIFNVAKPIDNDEPTNKEYVDSELSDLENNIEEKIKIEKVNLKISLDGEIIKSERKLKKDYEKKILLEKNNLEETFETKLQEKYDTIVKHDAFIRENGYHLATKGLNMGYKKILNVPDPSDDNEAVPKIYIDNLLKNINEKINKNLTTTTVLIRAEAEGPVVGIKDLSPSYVELKGILRGLIKTRDEGGTGGYINNGKLIHLTHFYFGKYHGGIFKYRTRDDEFLNPPLYLFPFKGTIFKISAVIKFFDNNNGPLNKKTGIKIFSFVENSVGLSNNDISVNKFDSNLFNSQDFFITTTGTANINFYCENINPFNVESCQYFGLLFLESEPLIEKVSLTLVARLNIEYPPELLND